MKRPAYVPELTGRRFGRLVAIAWQRAAHPNPTGWLCDCDCGAQTIVRTSTLTCGETKSCGCGSRKSRHPYNRSVSA